MVSISRYIEKVRIKSEVEKKRTAISWTIALTILIFIVWSISFGVSVANRQADDARLQAEANALAKTQALAESTSSVMVVTSQKKSSWLDQLGQIVADGADSVSEGFWAIGRWLHPVNQNGK